jgi:hypothetical protein
MTSRGRRALAGALFCAATAVVDGQQAEQASTQVTVAREFERHGIIGYADRMSGGPFQRQDRHTARLRAPAECRGDRVGAADKPPSDVVAAWDFAADPGSSRVPDLGPLRLHGVTANVPMRAITGHNWRQAEMDFHTRPRRVQRRLLP